MSEILISYLTTELNAQKHKLISNFTLDCLIKKSYSIIPNCEFIEIILYSFERDLGTILLLIMSLSEDKALFQCFFYRSPLMVVMLATD